MLLLRSRIRHFMLFPFAVLALLLLAGDAFAFGRGCSNCNGNARADDRGGPVRNLIGGFVDRVQARRDARAGGCQQAAPVAFQTTPPPEVVSAPVMYYIQPAGGYASPGSCPGGVCPVPTRR